MQDIWSTLFYVIIMVGVLLAAYYTTKFISGKTNRMLKSKYIQIQDRMSIGKDKALLVAKVGDKYLLLGVTNQNINSLGEVNPEDLSDIMSENKPQSGQSAMGKFAEFLANAKNAPGNLQKARMEAKQAKQTTTPPPAEYQSDNDYLDQINRAISQRKSRQKNNRADNEGMDE